MQRLLLALTRNAISLLGTALTTASAVVILTLFGLGFVGYHGGPYAGILTYLVFPAFFVLGLLLIPIGAWWEKRRSRRGEGGMSSPAFPVLDLNQARVRRAVMLVFVASIANATILALATYKGVEVMDSTEFCGGACHKVMSPEYTGHQSSSHARVKCVACHIGPGADSFVKAKLSGAWQVVSVTFDLYPRPIPAPVHDLRAADETCGECHSPGQVVGDRLKVIRRFAEDEANTERQTVALLKVGGIEAHESRGAHWHVDPRIRIRYRGDPSRKEIREIELTRADGSLRRFLSGGADPDRADGTGTSAEEWRTMDCVDCHNRSAHVYRTPANEVDAALERGSIERSLPFLKREALALLQEDYPSHAEARRRIPEGLEAFYAKNYPERLASDRDAVRAAGQALAEIYCSNVFPTMNVTWGTYPSHLGHTDSPGCFRCHGGEHKTAEGEEVSADCSLCHTLLAVDEENPEILTALGP